MLLATAPLFAAPLDRAAAEFALTCLARVRFLSEASLLALAGPRGLRPELIHDWAKVGLVHRGTVTTDALAGHEVTYLALTTRGAQTLQAVTGERVTGVPAGTLKRTAKRAHNLCVGEVAATFIGLEEERRVRLLGVEVDDRRIGTSTVVTAPETGPARVPLQPDAFIVIENDAGPTGILVEVDMGTTSVSRMARKYDAYLRWMRQSGPVVDYAMKALRVVTLTTTETRARRLHDAALEVNYGQRSGFLLFGLISDVNVCSAEKVFGPVVRQLGAEPNHRVPLFSAPSGDRALSAA